MKSQQRQMHLGVLDELEAPSHEINTQYVFLL
jgi:hypothetical protein